MLKAARRCEECEGGQSCDECSEITCKCCGRYGHDGHWYCNVCWDEWEEEKPECVPMHEAPVRDEESEPESPLWETFEPDGPSSRDAPYIKFGYRNKAEYLRDMLD